MKGVSVLVAAVLVIAISIAAVAIALEIGEPAIERSKEILIFEQGKDNLLIIDNAINQVLQEGDGSSRKINLQVTGGNYSIHDDVIEFTMISEQEIVSPGVTGEESGLTYEGSDGLILVYKEYDFDFIGKKEIIKGTHSLLVTNDNGDIAVS